MKLIYSYPRSGDRIEDSSIELFDLGRDPGEQHDLSTEQQELAHLLQGQLLAIAGGGPSTFEEEVPDDVDPELRRELEALGYFGDN
ncbi:MAG: hypothetical protein R2991_03140 [Thermoanaerobaculia bacterium]